MPRSRLITGIEAARLANEKRARLSLLPPESGDKQLGEPASSSPDEIAKKAPPRLRQPARGGNVLPAPKAELQGHKAAFRKLFGETLSDEFVDEMLTRLDLALAPGHWDVLEPGTLNAAIALIASINPQTELEALLAVQIVATGFAGLKLMQRGQSHLEEAYISVYGGYGTRLLRLQLELIQALDKHRRGHKQTVEVRHVHIHSGAQGVVGIINSGRRAARGRKAKNDGRPRASDSGTAPASQGSSMRSQDPNG